MSFSWIIILTENRQIQGCLPFQMRYFSDFLRLSWDVGTLVPNAKVTIQWAVTGTSALKLKTHITSPVSQAAMQAVKPWSIRTAFNTAVCILGFLDICLSLRESVWMCRCLYICPSEWLSSVLGCWSVNSDVCLCVWISFCLCVCLTSVCVYLDVHLSGYLYV